MKRAASTAETRGWAMSKVRDARGERAARQERHDDPQARRRDDRPPTPRSASRWPQEWLKKSPAPTVRRSSRRTEENSLLRRFLDRLYAASGVLAAICLAAICALMLAQAFGRTRRHPDPRRRRHRRLAVRRVRVPRARPHLPPRRAGARRPVARHARAARAPDRRGRARSASPRSSSPTCCGRRAASSTRAGQFNEVAQGLIKVPIWIPQLSFVIGVVIFFVAVLDELVAGAAGARSRPTRSPRKRAARRATSRRRCDERLLTARPRSCSPCCWCCWSAACGSRSRSPRWPGSGCSSSPARRPT